MKIEFDKDGYYLYKKKQGHPYINIFLVKWRKILFGRSNVVHFPKEFDGKRIKFKIEVIK